MSRKLSSAGEHTLHRGGVAGSNPAVSTKNIKTPSVTYEQVLGAKAPAELVTEGVLTFGMPAELAEQLGLFMEWLRNLQNKGDYSHLKYYLGLFFML